jgi:HptB-dependent secretion and biofilm anti anti-sigma factor
MQSYWLCPKAKPERGRLSEPGAEQLREATLGGAPFSGSFGPGIVVCTSYVLRWQFKIPAELAVKDLHPCRIKKQPGELPTMNANVMAKDGKAVIRLSGRFDFTVHREFREAVNQAMVPPDVREVQVDLGNVAYLDSSALGMLLMLRDKARAANRAVTLSNCRGSVKQVLDIANFSKLFPIA